MDIFGLLERHFILILLDLVKLKFSYPIVVCPLLLLRFALVGGSIS